MPSTINNTISKLAITSAIFILSACATSGSGHSKKTDQYLDETRVQLDDRSTEHLGLMIFIRKQSANDNIPSIFINERFIGSLPPQRFAETWVCTGEQKIRIDVRSLKPKKGKSDTFNIKPDETIYFQVMDSDNQPFQLQQIPESEAKNIKNQMDESHVVNRHQPVCNGALTVLKQINLSADALFKFDQTIMLPQGQEKVSKLVQDIISMGVQVEQIRIVGHTDRLGSDRYNDKLSLNRAIAVANLMKRKGIQVPILTEGLGEKEPVIQCSDKQPLTKLIACLQPNRRVSIELLGSLKSIENKGMSSQ